MGPASLAASLRRGLVTSASLMIIDGQAEAFDECVGTLAARQRSESVAAGTSAAEAAEGRDLVGVAAYRSSVPGGLLVSSMR